ncbi:hypothetical protein HK102_003965 [Quaeritorhiza haematococci]|nr:hypothetical protein HK102_003965 [Quaeritorhiza haematococci]
MKYNHPQPAVQVQQFSDHVPNETYCMEFKTVKSAIFKNLIKSLKFVLNEGNLVFTKHGMKMAAVDPRKIALVHLQIDESSFEFYHCDEDIVAGVDIGHLHRIVKTINANDTLSFFIDRHDKCKLGISLHNAEKQREVRYQLKLLQLTQYTITDSIEYDHYPPEVSSQEFQKICRDMASMGAQVVEIRNVNRQLIFKALGGIAEHKVIVNIVPMSGEVQVPSSVVQGTFLIKFLIAFAKATHLSPRVKILLKNNCPLIIEYNVSSLGMLQYVLSPWRG